MQRAWPRRIGVQRRGGCGPTQNYENPDQVPPPPRSVGCCIRRADREPPCRTRGLGSFADRTGTADRRAWHLARAASAPDELPAAALAEAAGRARDRRAHGTAARAFELAARLTPDPEVRAERLLSAAEAAHLAGHVSATLDYLDAARADTPHGTISVDVEHLRGRVAARMGSAATARDVLVAAADRCELADPRSAALMLADAVIPCLRSGRPDEALGLGRRALSAY